MTSAPTLPGLTIIEREELDWLLTSGVLGRSTNIARVLRYVCEESAAGRSEQLKEYTIAVEALGRRTEFDPQTDTIVRVTVHSLRKRLQEIYQGEGANRPLRIVIPSGHYTALFLPQRQEVEIPVSPFVSAEDLHIVEPELPVPSTVEAPLHSTPVSETSSSVAEPRSSLLWWVSLATIVSGIALWMGVAHVWRSHPSQQKSPSVGTVPAPSANIMGMDRHTYVDPDGQTWAVANYCQGGNNVHAPGQKFGGTESSYLFQEGVRGIVHCIFPVKRGIYELHTYLSEPSDLEPATRVALLSVNAGSPISVDVVDNADGDRMATATVVPGVTPENDGAIHLDFTSEVSPLNAIEILPTPTAKLLPVRIVASATPWIAPDRQIWLSDRNFNGGRRGLPSQPAGKSDLGLYRSDRIGRFRYAIPVGANAFYRVRLYFREPWFGQQNTGAGGPGSRVFDISANGKMLSENFDILAAGGGNPVVKTFDHVQATSTGMIEIGFIPVVNYPLVNAIEIDPEP
jgi:hypothetical protein